MSSQSNKASCVWKKNWALKPPKFIRWHCKASKAPLDLCNLANLAPICSTVSSLMTTTVPVHGDTSFSYQMTNCYQIGWLVTFVSVCFGSHHRYSDVWRSTLEDGTIKHWADPHPLWEGCGAAWPPALEWNINSCCEWIEMTVTWSLSK